MRPAAGGVPWFRRLSVRFACLMALTMIAFERGWVHVYDAVGEVIGLQPRRPILIEGEANSAGYGAALEGAEAPPIVLSQAEADREFDRLHALASAVTWGMMGAAALAMSFFVSWFVTRRLARLVQVATLTEGADLAQFDISGSDEIARLGLALRDSRARSAALVDELGARAVRRREWVAQVSHDLRTPLTALKACLERTSALLDALPPGPAREGLAEALIVAKHDTDRVAALAGDLFEVARLELPGALVLEELLPGEVVERVVSGLMPIAEATGRQLEFDAPGELPAVQGDGNRLLRVLENLVRNALQHCSQAVHVAVSADDSHVTIAVHDDGPGFPETEGRIDLERDSTRRADSAGLGLTVAAQIVAAHGDRLRLENRPQGGAAASFRLAVASRTLVSGRALTPGLIPS